MRYRPSSFVVPLESHAPRTSTPTSTAAGVPTTTAVVGVTETPPKAKLVEAPTDESKPVVVLMSPPSAANKLALSETQASVNASVITDDELPDALMPPLGPPTMQHMQPRPMAAQPMLVHTMSALPAHATQGVVSPAHDAAQYMSQHWAEQQLVEQQSMVIPTMPRSAVQHTAVHSAIQPVQHSGAPPPAYRTLVKHNKVDLPATVYMQQNEDLIQQLKQLRMQVTTQAIELDCARMQITLLQRQLAAAMFSS